MDFFKLVSGCAIVFVISCSSPGGGTRTEMQFSVDSSLVGKEVTNANLRIRYLVPSAWNEIPAPQLTGQPITINQILQKPDSTVTFSVTDIRNVPDSNLVKLDQDYLTMLNPSNQYKAIDKAEFEKAPFQVKQFIMSSDRNTNFKLLFFQNKKPHFQIDYTITLDTAYQTNTKTLESILGSLVVNH